MLGINNFTIVVLYKHMADPFGRAVEDVGLKPLDCWDRGFHSRWGHGCFVSLFVVCCVGSCLCDELITRSEESCRVCVCVCVTETPTMRRLRPELGCCYRNRRLILSSQSSSVRPAACYWTLSLTPLLCVFNSEQSIAVLFLICKATCIHRALHPQELRPTYFIKNTSPSRDPPLGV